MLAVTAMANLRPVEFAVWHIICSLAESEAPAALQASFKFFLKKVLTAYCLLVILPMPTATDE